MYKVGREQLETEENVIFDHRMTRKEYGLAGERQMQFQYVTSWLFPIMTGQY